MRTLTVVYGNLLLLLALTVLVSFYPLEGWSSAVSLFIAILKALLVLLFFMKLRESSGSLRLVALAAVLWLVFMFAMTGADYLTRGMAGILGK